jgi:hypothetical protein
VDRGLLSEEGSFRGKLCLTGIKWIKVSNKEAHEIPWKEYADGGILDFEIDNNIVFLLIEWTNYPPKPRTRDVSKIEIEAEKIDWENILDLPDDCCREDRGL